MQFFLYNLKYNPAFSYVSWTIGIEYNFENHFWRAMQFAVIVYYLLFNAECLSIVIHLLYLQVPL